MKVNRRTLLIGGGAGVGLVVAFALWPRHLGTDLALGSGEQAFGNYIKIARDGRITVAVPQVETGQGIWTALPQIVADELGAAWETIAVEPAPGNVRLLRRHQEKIGGLKLSVATFDFPRQADRDRKAAGLRDFAVLSQVPFVDFK